MQHEVERRVLLDVVVLQRVTEHELLAREDEALQGRWNSLLILNLGLDIIDRVAQLALKVQHALAAGHVHQEAHVARDDAMPRHEAERRIALDVVVRQGAGALERLAREDEERPVRRDAAFLAALALQLGPDGLDRVVGLAVERDVLTSQREHEDLHEVLCCVR
jgi:hypothetical protein